MWHQPVDTDSAEQFKSAYYSPYLSCSECNEIAFINSHAIGVAIAAGKSVETAHVECQETMPRCTGCSRTYTWVVGALNLAENVLDAAKRKREKKKKRIRSACVIQARVRGIAQRKLFADKLAKHRAVQRVVFRAATLVAKRYRGYRGRKVAEVERALVRIKLVSADALSEVIQSSQRRRVKRMVVSATAGSEKEIQQSNEQEMKEMEEDESKEEKERRKELNRVEAQALAIKKRDAIKLFWYDRKQEVDMLYRDYQLLVERTGRRPARFLVERNILTIAKKIHEKETLMATRIQARIRGVFGRWLITKYCVEVAYVRRVQTASAFVIQRVFRRWQGQLVRASRFADRRVKQITASWQLARNEQSFRDEKSSVKERLLQAYQQERRLESAARMLGKVSYGACNGNRMLAFKNSGYGRHDAYEVCGSMLELLNNRAEEMQSLDERSDARHREVEARCGGSDVFRMYFSDERQERREQTTHKMNTHGVFSSSHALKARAASLIKHTALRQAAKTKREQAISLGGAVAAGDSSSVVVEVAGAPDKSVSRIGRTPKIERRGR